MAEDPDLRPTGGFSMRGHSVGGFGSVTTNKVIATIAGDVFGKDVQAYPKYGSEKKGLPTTYYLTIADDAHLHALRTGARRPGRASTTRRRSSARRPLRAWSPGGAIFMQSHLRRPASRSGRGFPSTTGRPSATRSSASTSADMVKIAREVASVADLQMRMQGIVLLGRSSS